MSSVIPLGPAIDRALDLCSINLRFTRERYTESIGIVMMFLQLPLAEASLGTCLSTTTYNVHSGRICPSDENQNTKGINKYTINSMQ
jgi:hypothetical protein